MERLQKKNTFMQNEYEKTFNGNIIRNKFVYKGEIMSTKDVMKEILKEYKKFIKAGKDKCKRYNKTSRFRQLKTSTF